MNKGFSLVELIVVIAIMAILVGVAVPVYTSYIDKAESGVEAQYADELKRAVDTVIIDMKAGLSEVSGSTEETAVIPVKVEITGATVVVYKNATETIDNSDFAALLADIITLDSTSTVRYTFNID